MMRKRKKEYKRMKGQGKTKVERERERICLCNAVCVHISRQLLFCINVRQRVCQLSRIITLTGSGLTKFEFNQTKNMTRPNLNSTSTMFAFKILNSPY